MYCVTEFYDLKHFGTKITVFSTHTKKKKKKMKKWFFSWYFHQNFTILDFLLLKWQFFLYNAKFENKPFSLLI